MFFKQKLLSKILALVLVLQLLVNPIAVSVAFAEEVTPTPAPIESFVSPAPTIDPTVIPTPVSIIDTGNADSSSQTQTTANTNVDNVPGVLIEGDGACIPPEGQTACPNDINISNDNSADIGNSASSLASTGGNSGIGASGNVEILTGDATASGVINTEVNTNLVILEPTGSEAATQTTSGSVSEAGNENSQQTEQKSLNVENKNSADVNNNVQITASTGENLASANLGDAKIVTGDALAWANLLNFVNTNVVGSNFEMMVLDLASSGDTDINLNELWKQILEKQANDSLFLSGDTSLSNLKITIINDNKCKLENTVEVTADSGNNEANNNNSAEVNTGNATALANVNNFVNTNVLGSKFLFTIINILTDQNGNLILPRPELFMAQIGGSANSVDSSIFENQNNIITEDSVVSLSDSGSNQSINNGSENSTNTGNADSTAYSVTVANFNVWLGNYFYFRVNNLSGWKGNILGWTAPDSSETSQNGGRDFQISSDRPVDGTSEVSSVPLRFENTNEAVVHNNIKAQALTGENITEDNENGSQINTGNARSSANLFNFVNFNLIGSNFFFGMINILGNWTGNTIFAYPDLSLSLTNQSPEIEVGNTIDLTASYENKGYDNAKNSNIKLTIPTGLTYLNDTSGIKPVNEGENLSWSIGDLKPGEKSTFTVNLGVDPNFNFENLQSFWSKIIKNAYAVENAREKKISIIASIGTSDPESNTTNNSTSVETMVYQPIAADAARSNDEGDQRQPKLEIIAWNNVNNFVYPGDTVSFEIKIKNTSDVPSYNTIVTQKLYNGGPEDFGTFRFNIGTVNPGKEGKLSFGLKLPNDGTLKTDHYRTIAQAFGKAPDGNDISSNESKTNFDTKVPKASFIPNIVEAKETEVQEEGRVLGVTASCPDTKEILPYILLLTLSSLYLTSWVKFRLLKGFNA